jgi:hypothetical protein
MEGNYGKILTALLAVLFGVFALVVFVPGVELVVGFLSLTFGVLGIIWALRAQQTLSKGTLLRDYANYFLFSLIFIVAYSFWDTLVVVFGWKGGLVYPKFFLITVAYLIFVFAAYKILHLGKQFGFKPQVQKMKLGKKKGKTQKK